MREMATIRKIDNINPIPGADAIECATLGGWKVVVKKGEFNIGDLVVYLEVDSWVPTELAPFLTKGKEPREYNGVKGERLRTVKLRGQISQGLVLPLSVLGEKYEIFTIGQGCVGADVSEELNIQKYEPPVPAQLAGTVKGNFPTLVPKTDQERIQNLAKELEEYKARGLTFEVTEKLEGSSMTAYLPLEGDFEVCSRNLSLKRDEGNSFWKAAIEDKLEEGLRALDLKSGFGLALQGELIGPGIQGNLYGLSALEFHVYDIYDTEAGCYLTSNSRDYVCKQLGLNHVPVIQAVYSLANDDMASLLDKADGQSKLAKVAREGLVYKCREDPSISFKTISNAYLLKHG